MLLALVVWAFFLLVALAALGSASVLVAGLGLGGIAVAGRLRSGIWPLWAGKVGAALAIAATIAAPVGVWIGYVASR